MKNTINVIGISLRGFREKMWVLPEKTAHWLSSWNKYIHLLWLLCSEKPECLSFTKETSGLSKVFIQYISSQQAGLIRDWTTSLKSCGRCDFPQPTVSVNIPEPGLVLCRSISTYIYLWVSCIDAEVPLSPWGNLQGQLQYWVSRHKKTYLQILFYWKF